MTSICSVKGELRAEEARRLTERAHRDIVDAATMEFLEAVFRLIKKAAMAGDVELRYEVTSLDPRIIATVLKYLRCCGYKVAELHGVNDHSSANGSSLVGGAIRWAREMLPLEV